MLCLCIMASCTAVGFAKGEKKSDYPFIYVHGNVRLGDGAPQKENRPYWGTQPENNVMTYLRAQVIQYTIRQSAVTAAHGTERASFMHSLPALLLTTVRRTQKNAAMTDSAEITQAEQPWEKHGILRVRANFVGHTPSAAKQYGFWLRCLLTVMKRK